MPYLEFCIIIHETHCGLDAKWHQRSWSTLVHVMAWCLTAPSHYLNKSTKTFGIHSQVMFIWILIDCFMPLLARHLADVSCYIGPSMPSGICMEIHTEIVQKRKKKPSHNKGTPRQPHVYLKIDQSRQHLEQPITNLDRNILRGHQRT